MSISDRLTSLFGSNDDEAPTIEALETLFREREATLDLTAEFHQPAPNMNDEPTAVFPYTLLDSDGEVYGSGAKEFLVPDEGFKDNDAPVTEFIGGLTDTPTEDVGVGALRAVGGALADAELNDEGDIIVNVPDAPEPTEDEDSEEATEDDGGRASDDALSTSDFSDSSSESVQSRPTTRGDESDDSEGGDE